MLTTTLLTFALACKPMTPPPPRFEPVGFVTSRCEGPDVVTRDHDHREVSRRPGGCLASVCEGPDLVSRDDRLVEYRRQRFSASCVTTRCEGSDLVRRDVRGTEYSRVSFAPGCVVARCEGSDLVTRDGRGFEVSRATFRCAPPPPVRLTQQPDAWRYGLTSR